MSDTTEIEFVNDWSELEAAIVITTENGWGSSCGCCSSAEDDDAHYEALQTIKSYVPRLLTQYAKLLELSYVLTDLVEKQNALNTPTGLYLPDHR